MRPLRKVAVIMATHNGMRWLDEQLSSILNQSGVSTIVFVSDDFSYDGTFEHLAKFAVSNNRVVLLPQMGRMGSAGRNFYRLLRDVNFSEFDYVAFADQDDIWNLDKLSSHIQLINKHEAEAISSNVLAFWPDGTQKLIVKSQPQQAYDYLFESAGPGCTFLMTLWLVSQIKQQLSANEWARDVTFHDWLAYAVCRAHDKKWIINPEPSMRYRQHLNNVVGANSGLRAVLTRLKKIKSGWYRHQVALIARVVASINPNSKLSNFQKIIQRDSILNQFRLLPYALKGRRKFTDRLVLLVSIILFVF